MTYAMSFNNVGFAELTRDEMLCVDGGGFPWDKFGEAVAGGAGAYIGASAGAKVGAMIGTTAGPIGAVAGGILGAGIGVALYCWFD